MCNQTLTTGQPSNNMQPNTDNRTTKQQWGSPVGAVGLALRSVNEVKLDRARLVRGWVTRPTVSIGHWLWADQLRPLLVHALYILLILYSMFN